MFIYEFYDIFSGNFNFNSQHDFNFISFVAYERRVFQIKFISNYLIYYIFLYCKKKNKNFAIT